MARLGRIPEPGDEVTVAGRTLRVEELDGLRVAMVRMMG
jgi:CBS domain containing-hemolysin-like protein